MLVGILIGIMLVLGVVYYFTLRYANSKLKEFTSNLDECVRILEELEKNITK